MNKAPAIPPMPTIPTVGQVSKVKQAPSVPAPLSKGRKSENGKRVEALVALDKLMDHLPSIQDDPIELIRYIDHVCARGKCNMITTPLLSHLGVDALGTSLEDYPASVLLMILGFLYEGSCVIDPATQGCKFFEDNYGNVSVMRKYNPDAPKTMGQGEIPNYVHTVCIGFPSKDAMTDMATHLYSTPDLGCKVLGFRDNTKHFRTAGDYELKAWFSASQWREQNVWLSTL